MEKNTNKYSKKTILIVCTIILLIGSFNYFSVMKPLSDVLSKPGNSGINMNAHYQGYLRPNVLVIDMRSIEGTKSMADVFRVILQYSHSLKGKNFDAVLLQSKGKTKFQLKGNYFQQLGQEYDIQNPVYTMRTFPENVYTPDGGKAFGTWSGGLLGVLTKQMDDLAKFHKQWYIEDMDH